MKNTLTMLAAAAVLLVLSLGSAARPAAADGSYYFNFEQGVKPWIASANDHSKGYTLDIREGENGCRSPLDFHFARMEFIATDDAPGAWMQTSFQGSGVDTLTLDFAAKNAEKCESCQTIVYVGRDVPKNESQFKTVKPATTGAANQWQSYHYQVSVLDAGVVHVAIGFRGPVNSLIGSQPGSDDVAAGIVRAGGIDCLNVNIQSLAEAK